MLSSKNEREKLHPLSNDAGRGLDTCHTSDIFEPQPHTPGGSFVPLSIYTHSRLCYVRHGNKRFKCSHAKLRYIPRGSSISIFHIRIFRRLTSLDASRICSSGISRNKCRKDEDSQSHMHTILHNIIHRFDTVTHVSICFSTFVYINPK